MIRDRQPEALALWLKTVCESGIGALSRFAKGLQQDFEAIKAALCLPWSNGQTEGQVNRLKLIKRQMYGRAKFDLLRKRVLHPGFKLDLCFT
jgi:transposase